MSKPTNTIPPKLQAWIQAHKRHLKRFGRERPEVVVTIEERARQLWQQKADRKAAKAKRRSDSSITGDAS